jgi:hypothetical protein
MKATLHTKLTGKAAPGEHLEPFGTLQHVAHFPHDGVICQLKLGQAGLQYQRGDLVHVIPTPELIAYFEKADPKFAEKPNKKSPPE